MYRADGRNQRVRRHALKQIGTRAGLQSAIDVFVAVVCGEHDQARVWHLHADALDDVHSAHARQPQVNQRDIRQVLAELRDGLRTVSSFAHNLKAVYYVEQCNQPLAHNMVVLDNQHANRFLRHWVSPNCTFVSRAALTRSLTVVPAAASLTTSSVPPIVSARSLIPVKP